MSFSVIAAADDLSQDQRDQLLRDGREDLDARPGYPTLLQESGFDLIEMANVTAGYQQTLAGWIREWNTEAAELISLLGEEEFNDRQARRVRSLNSIQSEEVVRYWITATKP